MQISTKNLVSFRNRGSCSPDCRDWSVFVRSSPLYKRAHGEDIFICSRELRMGWLPGRLLNRLSRAKLIKPSSIRLKIAIFQHFNRHVIVVDTEGGCDCLSDATRLVCSLFLNLRPRSTLSTAFYISYQQLDGELVEGSLMAFIHQLELCISVYLTSFTTHSIHFQKIKWKELVTVRIRRINFSPTAAKVFCLFEPEPPLTSAPMRIENWTDAQWMFRL
ncbi:hypothetical protein T07_14089 [Trichinella nelsoni]|uniref:Uncharacterized protein n=1 Tax=Trichinella nelsoni TaxID=6336 RepID=A0A0V0S5A8_9BILA|nr:hypothetical protein T07_14089 [Trichinella nelsoni]